jgi:hypothetical protein
MIMKEDRGKISFNNNPYNLIQSNQKQNESLMSTGIIDSKNNLNLPLINKSLK